MDSLPCQFYQTPKRLAIALIKRAPTSAAAVELVTSVAASGSNDTADANKDCENIFAVLSRNPAVAFAP